MRLNRFHSPCVHDPVPSFSRSLSAPCSAASRTRNASRRYRVLARIKGDNKRGGNETVVSERNEDRAISYRTPSARKQFIPLHCSTLIRPTFFFHLSDSIPTAAEIFWSRLLLTCAMCLSKGDISLKKKRNSKKSHL